MGCQDRLSKGTESGYNALVMLRRLGNTLSRIAERVVPDPFVLVLGLTLLVLLAGALHLNLAGGEQPAGGVAARLLLGWYHGFWNPDGLVFAVQMCLILITGHTLAVSGPVRRLIEAAARLPRGPAGAAALVSAVSCVAALLHWGLGAVAGALLAREMARVAPERGVRLHYPLLGAAAYTGMALWHGGLSGSAPLKVAESGHFLASTTGEIPLADTLLSPLNLAVCGALLVLVPALCWALAPRRPEDCVAPIRTAEPVAPTAPARPEAPARPALERFQCSAWPGRVLGLIGLALVLTALVSGRVTLDLSSVIVAFLLAAIVLHGSLTGFAASVGEAARGAGAILIQFPLYFAILGVLRAGDLVHWLAASLAEQTGPSTLPVVSFLSAGLVNLFVPSGGGQWTVQGEILATAGAAAGVDPVTTVMAFAYGDAWTNMLQPFWALPLLAITGLQARQIIGYTAVIFALLAIVVPPMLWLLG